MPVRLFTTEQVANILGASPSAVDEWMHRGWLPFQRLPNGPVRVSERGLLRFLKDRGVDIREIAEKIAASESQEGQYVPEPAEARGEVQTAVAERQAPDPVVTPAQIAARHLARTSARPADPLAAKQALQAEAVAKVAAEAQAPLPEPAPETPPEPAPQPAVQPPAETPPALPEPPPPALPEPPPEPPKPKPAKPKRAKPKPAKPKPATAGPADGRARQIAEAILTSAVDAEATSIYIQPESDGLHLRMRIDGVIHERSTFRQFLPKGVAGDLVAYLLALAGPEQGNRPLEGRFVRTIHSRDVRFRVSAWPTGHGQALALAVADPARRPMAISQLGLADRDEQRLGRMLASPSGLIVVADPSGRCIDVLRAMAGELNTSQRHVVTIERFADVEIPGAIQAQIDPAAGFGFAEATRFLAAVTPDVLLVGDLRDPPTALAACAAAEDRTMVLAGIKAATAPAAAAMLLEMGLSPWPLANTLLATVAKATFRRLCPQCKKPARKKVEVARRKILLANLNLTRKELGCTPLGPRGCPNCSQTGYRGATGAFSVMYVDGDLLRLLRSGASPGALAEAWALTGTKTLLQTGLEKLRDGETSLEELARAMGPVTGV